MYLHSLVFMIIQKTFMLNPKNWIFYHMGKRTMNASTCSNIQQDSKSGSGAESQLLLLYRCFKERYVLRTSVCKHTAEECEDVP